MTDAYVFVLFKYSFLGEKILSIHVNKKLPSSVKKFIRKIKRHGNLKIDIFTVLLVQTVY